MEEDIEFVGVRVRQWRDELGLSLQDLSDRCGVAPSTIQKVETGQMVPSIAIALKIARGLDRRPAELLSSEPEEADVVFMRSKEHSVIDSRQKLRVERLSGDLFDPSIEMWRVTVYPGFSSGSGVHGYEGEEVIVCEEGQIHFTVGDEEFELGQGDSLHFKAGIPHRWWNPGRRIARFLIAGNFPRGLRKKLHLQVQTVKKDKG